MSWSGQIIYLTTPVVVTWGTRLQHLASIIRNHLHILVCQEIVKTMNVGWYHLMLTDYSCSIRHLVWMRRLSHQKCDVQTEGYYQTCQTTIIEEEHNSFELLPMYKSAITTRYHLLLYLSSSSSSVFSSWWWMNSHEGWTPSRHTGWWPHLSIIGSLIIHVSLCLCCHPKAPRKSRIKDKMVNPMQSFAI